MIGNSAEEGRTSEPQTPIDIASYIINHVGGLSTGPALGLRIQIVKELLGHFR